MTQHRIALIVNDLELINTQKRALRKRSEDISVVMEVYENDYKNNPNAFETFEGFLENLVD